MSLSPTDHSASRRLATIFSAAIIAVVAALVVLTAAPSAHAAAKGIADNCLEYHGGIDLKPVSFYAAQMGPSGLGAKWTRVYAYWDQLMPDKPKPGVSQSGDLDGDGFNDAYVHELETVVSALHAQGMSVILSGSDAPRWAYDTRYKKYWNKNNLTQTVVRADDAVIIGAFKKYAAFLAGHFAGEPYGVRHFEVWNEPNLRLIPQVVNKKIIGPKAYLLMLKAFSKGAHGANRQAVVIAGATSRMGSNGTGRTSTSPQWFAKYLKSHGATKWFDAYSHHPYSTKGSSPKPSAKPQRADLAVTLGNLGVLLKIFPRTDFYLTEYCLAAKTVGKSFVVVVSKADQARYLREAFALLARPQYKRVKAMLWYQVRDWQASPSLGAASPGLYTGLVDWTGQRRPAWYAFAGGNRISISAPSGVVASDGFSVTGTLTTSQGGLAGHEVVLQRRSLTGKSWAKFRTVTTGADGAYSFEVSQTAATRYRVVWDGVCESSGVTVGVQR